MPPEFFEHGIYGLQSDVWSYGVLLWEVLSAGAIPYKVGRPIQETVLLYSYTCILVCVKRSTNDTTFIVVIS